MVKFFSDEITRDFVPNVGDPETRKAKLIPWVPADMTDVDYFQKEPDVSFFQRVSLTQTTSSEVSPRTGTPGCT